MLTKQQHFNLHMIIFIIIVIIVGIQSLKSRAETPEIDDPSNVGSEKVLSEPVRFEKANEGTFRDQMEAQGKFQELKVLHEVVEKDYPGYVTDSQEVLGEWYWQGKRNLHSVPKWKFDVVRNLGIAEKSARKMFTLNNLECGREDGMCIGDAGYSYGPFQIHKKYHPESGAWSEKLVRAGLASQLDEDERQDIYTTYGIPQDLFYLTKHELAEKLYAFQVTWLAQRMLGFEEKYCQYKPNESLKVKCQGILHNGGLPYGLKAMIIYDLLTEKVGS